VWVYVRCQSDRLVGVSSVVGVSWWCDGVGGTVSVSVVAIRWNQLVRGLVLAGGSCCLDLFRGRCGASPGFLGLCEGGCSCACVRSCVGEGVLVPSSVGVLVGLACADGWPLCFCCGGRFGDGWGVGLSRVGGGARGVLGVGVSSLMSIASVLFAPIVSPVCCGSGGPLGCRTRVRCVTADAFRTSLKGVFQKSSQSVKCVGRLLA
jgi:hypothetical protein